MRRDCLILAGLLLTSACSSSDDAPAGERGDDPATESGEEDEAGDGHQPADEQNEPTQAEGSGGRSPVGTSMRDGAAAIRDAGRDAGAREAEKEDASRDAAKAGSRADAGKSLSSKPKCVVKDSQVIILGDSFVSWISHTFPEDIKRVTGQAWRMEAVGGFSMASGGFGSIPQQFRNTIALDPDAHAILMTGGGNDILLPDPTRAALYECTMKGATMKANCTGIVASAVEMAQKFMIETANAGIRDVVYFFYPHVPANTIATGDNPDEMLDYALPMVRDTCASAERLTDGRLRCTFVDFVPYFQGHPEWINTDIHPSPAGSAAMAEHLWDVMSDKCIGQKGPRDCCE